MKIGSKAMPGKTIDYPLFVTTQESSIGLFTDACEDCHTTGHKFLASDAVGYKTGSD